MKHTSPLSFVDANYPYMTCQYMPVLTQSAFAVTSQHQNEVKMAQNAALSNETKSLNCTPSSVLLTALSAEVDITRRLVGEMLRPTSQVFCTRRVSYKDRYSKLRSHPKIHVIKHLEVHLNSVGHELAACLTHLL